MAVTADQCNRCSFLALCRDLKPDNILLGEGGHIFLTYFSQVGELEKEIDWNAVEHMYVAPGELCLPCSGAIDVCLQGLL